jgi:3D (Asp-Asp-Asp) domain-containing protein
MDELTALRNTRDDSRVPSPTALAAGRAALLNRIADGDVTYATVHPRKSRRWMPRLSWAAAAVAAAMTGILVAGNVTLTAQSAYASDVLRTAATQTIQYADLVAGSEQYLRSRTHARWGICDDTGCTPNDQILDVYMPANPEAEWTLYRDWGNMPGMSGGKSIETTRAVDGQFYGPESSWVIVDYADIPLDGVAAYEWINAQYNGGSASRDEDNFVRITDILRSGLVPAPQRAALLDALSRISGVTATDDVANLDGVTGIAIGRNEILRAGQRQEIIIDPDTGLVIGERTMSGATLFGWGLNEEMSLTAIETTIVDTAP